MFWYLVYKIETMILFAPAFTSWLAQPSKKVPDVHPVSIAALCFYCILTKTLSEAYPQYKKEILMIVWGRCFFLYSEVRCKRRERNNFLMLEGWLPLKYNFHLGTDTDISNTSCYSLNSYKGCYKPPEVAIHKFKRATMKQIHDK